MPPQFSDADRANLTDEQLQRLAAVRAAADVLRPVSMLGSPKQIKAGSVVYLAGWILDGDDDDPDDDSDDPDPAAELDVPDFLRDGLEPDESEVVMARGYDAPVALADVRPDADGRERGNRLAGAELALLCADDVGPWADAIFPAYQCVIDPGHPGSCWFSTLVLPDEYLPADVRATARAASEILGD